MIITRWSYFPVAGAGAGAGAGKRRANSRGRKMFIQSLLLVLGLLEGGGGRNGPLRSDWKYTDIKPMKPR